DEVRHPQLGVAVLARVEVEHELGERALEARARPPEDREARLGDLDRAREVEQAERFADLLVRLGREAERARGAPASDLDVLLVALAGRAGGGGGVRGRDQL